MAPSRVNGATALASSGKSKMLNTFVDPQQPGDAPQVHLTEVRTSVQIHAVSELMREFVSWQDVRHAGHRKQLAAYFDPHTFEEELARLPEPFEPPSGRLFLASVGDVPAACAGLKPLGYGDCEMKRLYLRPQFRGLGIGRMLVSRLIQEALEIGYSSMRLETGPLQVEAQGLYVATGFRRIPPYRRLPSCLRDWLICMERPLKNPSVSTTASV